ncbi:GDP-mannose 4,6-dehydratase [Sulfurospirillum diekertiae]|uniref:GDP-mannose 4,6-dehydratase n=1 Tax=Sulfurospirillum diekertiae TaxID=1854492 RepID=A0A6G9VS25_9BACT|nr:GDP-mannose 4,6-dehydratase [Sulfurospirillum diekertiae]QIR78088.1 GDP-mannose 4,6-dehydratase [Sulfurospirillum diekertiae]
MKLALASKKVLITGIDSFTGYHLKTHLKKQGYNVYGTVFSNGDEAETFTCNITNKENCLHVMRQIQPNFLIHLAGISYVGHDDVEALYKVNTLGTQNVLDALCTSESNVQKVILASSATVYGDQGCEELEESMCPKPANHYGISKLAMEHMARGYFAKLPITIVRPFNYTGIGQPEHFLVPKIVSHFKRREQTIELGNLHVAREFNDVAFTCKVYEKLLESTMDSDIVNLCSGKAISLMEIISLMNAIAGYEIEVKVNPSFVRDNEIKRLVGSTQKLEKTIDHICPIELEETLRKMYEA